MTNQIQTTVAGNLGRRPGAKLALMGRLGLAAMLGVGACDSGNSEDQFAADSGDRAAIDMVNKLVGFAHQALEAVQGLAGDNILARCVYTGNCSASDEEYFEAVAHAHEVMKCNSPFRGMFMFAAFEPEEFNHWLEHKPIKLPKLPFELNAMAKVVVFYGPDIETGDFIGGAHFIPIGSTFGELAFEVKWGEPGVHKLYITPEIGKGTYIGGYASLDLHEVGIYAGASVGHAKIGGQTIKFDTGVILAFDPKRLKNYLNPDYWNLHPIGDCGEHGGGGSGDGMCSNCLKNGGGSGCASRCEGTRCVECVANGGGLGCEARCNECAICVESSGGKACAAKCGGNQCLECVESGYGQSCADQCTVF